MLDSAAAAGAAEIRTVAPAGAVAKAGAPGGPRPGPLAMLLRNLEPLAVML